MAPSKMSSWDDEESESTPPSSPPAVARRGKFDDEEDDEDVLDDWDAAEDSEAEREKEKKAAEAKAKAEAAAKAAHKSKTQRIEEKRETARLRKEMEDLEGSSDEDEDESDKRARLRAAEKEADMANAEELFGGVGGVPKGRSAAKPVTIQDEADPNNTIDLSALKLFSPATATQFGKLRETLVPLLNANGKKPQYSIFLQQLTKEIVRDLSSEQVKKIASGLTTVSNEKMKEEKAADKGGKKSKAAKNKNSLAASRDVSHRADITAYDDDGLDE